ncbi:hypothetical protein E2C01_050200 [Portunus trituberculatus]|uniref:Uncharacterized protein n=1 Tax=Portunus trituberculatus TaxID=210409 RepID=A0A5B7GG28_PORTR|nr:hypothetical protein [Portunus trituberculatus]
MTDLTHCYSPRPLHPAATPNGTQHTPLYSVVAYPTTSPQYSKVINTYRPMPDSALRGFGQWVTQHPWDEVLEMENVHTKWHNFVTTTTKAFHCYFQAKSVTVHPSDAPWITPRIKRLIKQRN